MNFLLTGSFYEKTQTAMSFESYWWGYCEETPTQVKIEENDELQFYMWNKKVEVSQFFYPSGAKWDATSIIETMSTSFVSFWMTN